MNKDNLIYIALILGGIVIIFEQIRRGVKFFDLPVSQATEALKKTITNRILKNAFKDVKTLDDIRVKVIMPYRDIINAMSNATFIEPEIIASVIWVESRGRNLIGKNGEIGLMQIKPIAMQDVNENFGRTYRTKDLDNPITNIQVGSMFLKLQLRRMKNIFDALRAYNQGASAAKANQKTGANYAEAVQIIARQIQKANLI